MNKDDLRQKLLEAREAYLKKNATRLEKLKPVWESTQKTVPDITQIEPYIDFCDTEDKQNLWWYGRVTVSSAPLCYDANTDILTESGWKNFSDLLKSDKVATLNPSTNELEYQLPSNYVNQHYSGEMFKQSGSVDLLVTPNHKLYISRDKCLDFNLVEAERSNRHVRYTSKFVWKGTDIPVITLPAAKRIPKGCHYDDIVVDMNIFVKLLGFYLAEGHCTKYRICLTQNVGTKLDKFLSVLDDGKIRYTVENKSPTSRRITIYGKTWVNYFEQFGKCDSKFIPTAIKNLPVRYLKSLLEYMMLGDGTTRNRRDGSTERSYSTISKKLADDVNEICLKIGYNSKIRTYYNNAGNTAYIVSFNPTYETYNPNSHIDLRTKEYYSGNIYCVTVPNHIIMVRRNGKPVWCGNSGEVGRRIHYLIRDRQTGFILGMVGLASDLTIPIRDRHIGWTKTDKWQNKRINYIMNVQHAVATAPLNEYLTGKLCALSVTSKEVQDAFETKYGHKLAGMTVTSLYGKSSVYNRLQGFDYLGTTKGYSSVLIPLEVKQKMREDFKATKGKYSETYTKADGTVVNYGVVKGYQKLAKYTKVQSVENFRGVYWIPLSTNYQDFLCSKTDIIDSYQHPTFNQVVAQWRERWLNGRIERMENSNWNAQPVNTALSVIP